MIKKWWEDPLGFVCDYWWIFLILILLGLVIYFTRTTWMPLLGLS
jgi:hypothetical protein